MKIPLTLILSAVLFASVFAHAKDDCGGKLIRFPIKNLPAPIPLPIPLDAQAEHDIMATLKALKYITETNPKLLPDLNQAEAEKMVKRLERAEDGLLEAKAHFGLNDSYVGQIISEAIYRANMSPTAAIFRGFARDYHMAHAELGIEAVVDALSLNPGSDDACEKLDGLIHDISELRTRLVQRLDSASNRLLTILEENLISKNFSARASERAYERLARLQVIFQSLKSRGPRLATEAR